jgi:hypothetical protein
VIASFKLHQNFSQNNSIIKYTNYLKKIFTETSNGKWKRKLRRDGMKKRVGKFEKSVRKYFHQRNFFKFYFMRQVWNSNFKN